MGLGPSFRMPDAAGDSNSVSGLFLSRPAVLIPPFTAIFATISIIEDRREGFLQSVPVAPHSTLVDGAGQDPGGTPLALVQGLAFRCWASWLAFASGRSRRSKSCCCYLVDAGADSELVSSSPGESIRRKASCHYGGSRCRCGS